MNNQAGSIHFHEAVGQFIHAARVDLTINNGQTRESEGDVPIVTEQNSSPRAPDEAAIWHQVMLEEQRQYDEFLRKTKMRASRMERIELTKLFTNYPITHVKVAEVWNQQDLTYRDNRLYASPRKWSVWVGSFLSFFMLLMSWPVMEIFVTKNIPPLQSTLLLAIIASNLLFSTWLFFAFYRPYRIALRLQPMLEDMYRA